MDYFFIVAAALSALGAIMAVTQVRSIGWAVWIWFGVGMVNGELAITLIGAQLAFIALWVATLGADTAGFALGLSLFIGAWILLGIALKDGFDAGAAFNRALGVALGRDYLASLPASRRVKLQQHIHSRDWLRPFRFRRRACATCVTFLYLRGQGLLTLPAGKAGISSSRFASGAWWRLDDGPKSEQGQPLLHRMVEMGWVGVSINYRLAPRDAYPAQIIDVKKAIAWVKQNIAEYGGDPDFIVVTGGSAGGHLSLLAGLTPGHADWQEGFEGVDTAVQGVLAMYPVVDLTNRHGIRHQDRMDSFITRRIVQQTREAVPHIFEDGSPNSWIHREGVAAAAPPFCIVQGTHDSLVWVEEVRRFVAEFSPLTSHPLVYTELPGAQHAFEILHSPRTSHFLNAAAAWLEWVRARQGHHDVSPEGKPEASITQADERSEND